MLAAIQVPIIMMSRKRGPARDRLDAEADHELNVRAELAASLLSCTPAFGAGMKTSTTGVIFDLK